MLLVLKEIGKQFLSSDILEFTRHGSFKKEKKKRQFTSTSEGI